jgi:thioredoxin-like negative regulator of GroEL
MGDLDAAKRSLDNLRDSSPETNMAKMRKALLLLRIGDIDAASKVFSTEDESSRESALLRPLLSMAEGRYPAAVEEWQALQQEGTRTDDALVAQNLAVCLLYTGRLDEVCCTPKTARGAY